jgi:hypothetical protein
MTLNFLSFQLIENTASLKVKRPVNMIQENNLYLLWKLYETHE